MLPLREESQSGEATKKQAVPRGVSSGRTLASLSSEEPANLDRILRIFVDVLRLLDSIHSNGLQHDSLAPPSIRLDDKDKPEIRTRSSALETFDTLGFANPKYALPESFREGPENSPCTASDCYVLGFMLYELLLGGRRFRAQFAAIEAGNSVAWLRWHADRSRKLIPLAELIPNFPRSVSNLIGDMTEKDPARRAELPSIMRTLRCADQATIVSSSPTAEKGTFLLAKVKSLRPRFRLGQISGFFQRLKQNTLTRENARSSNGVKNELQQWAIIRDLRPSFTNLKSNLRRLMRGPGEAPQLQLRTGGAMKWIVAMGVALALLTGGLLADRHLTALKPSGTHLVPVALHANIAGTLFTVDGRPSLSGSVDLAHGSHQAEASAPGYESLSKRFTVSGSGSASVAFTLKPLLTSLHVTSALKGAQYILDGDGPMDLDGGALTKEHLPSGTHSLEILKEGTPLFSLGFTAAPQKTVAINAHTERENISVLIISAFKDSAKLYASRNWAVSLEGGSSRPVSTDGLDLHAHSAGNAEVVATSVDGEIQKLNIAQSRTPVLNISVKSLPERIPVTILANVSDPVVLVNGRRSDARMVNGRGVLTIFPGKYRISLRHRGYYDSLARQVAVHGSAAEPVRLRFVLRPLNRHALRHARY